MTRPPDGPDAWAELRGALARVLRAEGGPPAPGGEPVEGWVDRLVTSAVRGGIAGRRAAADRPHHAAAGKLVVIVGGAGAMGRAMAPRFGRAGCAVRVVEEPDWADGSAPAALAAADAAVLSVPIDKAEAVARRTGPALRDDAVLADVTSVKRPALAAMLDAHAGPVVGLHPMFGPGLETWLAQKIVVCPGRRSDEGAWLVGALAAEGAKVVEMTAEAHDRAMVAVQALRHLHTMAFGAVLERTGLDLADTLRVASPIYRLELGMVSRLFAQDAGLYARIITGGPDRRAAAGEMARAVAELCALAERGDVAGLEAVFARVRSALGDEVERAADETGAVVEALTAKIAAETHHSDRPAPKRS